MDLRYVLQAEEPGLAWAPVPPHLALPKSCLQPQRWKELPWPLGPHRAASSPPSKLHPRCTLLLFASLGPV